MHGYYLEEEFLYQEVQKRFRAAAENRTHDYPNASSDALATELPRLYGQQGWNLIQRQSTVSGTCSKSAVHQRTRPRLHNIIVLCYVIITLEKDINPKFSLHIKLNLLCTRRDHTL